MEDLDKWTGTIDASITNRTKEMEERIPGFEDMLEEIDSSLK